MLHKPCAHSIRPMAKSTLRAPRSRSRFIIHVISCHIAHHSAAPSRTQHLPCLEASGHSPIPTAPPLLPPPATPYANSLQLQSPPQHRNLAVPQPMLTILPRSLTLIGRLLILGVIAARIKERYHPLKGGML